MTNVIEFPANTTRHAPGEVITGKKMLNGVSKAILCSLIHLAIERDHKALYELYTDDATKEECRQVLNRIAEEAKRKRVAGEIEPEEADEEWDEIDMQEGEPKDESVTIVSLNDLEEVLNDLAEFECWPNGSTGDGEGNWWRI